MCYYIQGTSYPFYAKDDLQEQMPFISKKYPTYESYAKQRITDIFSAEELRDALVLKASLFESCYLENTGNNQFKITSFATRSSIFTYICHNIQEIITMMAKLI